MSFAQLVYWYYAPIGSTQTRH